MNTFEISEKDTNPKNAINNKFMDGHGTIQDDLKSIREGGIGLVRHVKDDAIEGAQNMINEGGHKYEELKSSTGKYVKLVEKEVLDNPMRSMAIALGIGAFLSLFLRRS